MTDSSVLIVTASYDEAPVYVERALEFRGTPFFRLDTDRFPSEINASFDPYGGIVFSDGVRSISAKDIKSVWYRRNVPPVLPEALERGTRDFCERETRAFLEGTLLALPTRQWLSFPQSIWCAEHKPYQLAVAAQLGFTIPPTLITNDQKGIPEFVQGRSLVGKAVHSGFLAGSNGNKAIFTSALSTDDFADLSGLTLAPVTFQEKVEKLSDIRVTVIGTEVFAAEILSQAEESSKVDWRATEDPNLEHRRHELPLDVAHACRSLISRLGLNFGAIDLALTGDGDYVFFEINPNGEWLWLEDLLSFPISDRIAEWLSL